MILERVTIDPRFCGPPDTGNGGYVSGLLAQHVAGPAEVTLRAPAPLGRELCVRSEAKGVALHDGDALLAQARSTSLDLEVPDSPGLAAARATAGSCRAFKTHPFPRCFVCGPERGPGDGLQVFPGSIEGSDLVAAPWTPDPSLADDTGAVRPELIWAVLDCPSAFPLLEAEEARHLEPMLLGRLAAGMYRPLRPGERCVVIAWPIALEGRKGLAGSAIFSESGDLAAAALATWISLAQA